MSHFKRDLFRKRLRSALAAADDDAFLNMIWALGALRSGRENLAARIMRFPEDAATNDPASKFAIHNWELETLVNQLLLVDKLPLREGPNRRYDCRDYDTAATFVNTLRGLEDAESAIFLRNRDVLSELHRIGQRQFHWQRGYLNQPNFYRSTYIYGQGGCAEHLRDQYGVTINELSAVGFALFAQFQSAPIARRSLDLNWLGLTPEVTERAVSLLALPLFDAKETLLQMMPRPEAGMWQVAYQPSLLRRYPVLATGSDGEMLRAPLPELILLRITSGIYYDLISGRQGLRHEAADRFEEYCASYLGHMLPRFDVRRAYRYQSGSRGNRIESPDILIRDHGSLAIAVECKATKLSFVAQFGNNPAQEASVGYEELGKGIFQLWRYFSHCRRGLANDTLTDYTLGLLVTLDTWLVMSRELQSHVFSIANGLADDEQDILPEDRRSVLFASIQDLEATLARCEEGDFLGILSQAREDRFLGWLLPNIRAELGAGIDARRPYPFELGEMLPWWAATEEERDRRRTTLEDDDR